VAAKVLNRFRVDFDIFGYSTELSEANLPPRNLDGAADTGRGASESILRPIIRAAVAEKRGDVSEALQLLSSVTSDEPELDVTRARLLIELGRQREALALLQGVVARVDNVGKYWMQLAECLNNKEAAEAADKAVAVAPYLGVLQRALRTWKKAGETEKVEDCKNKIASIMETSPKKRKGKRLQLVGANGHIHPKRTAAARRRAHSLAR